MTLACISAKDDYSEMEDEHESDMIGAQGTWPSDYSPASLQRKSSLDYSQSMTGRN